MEHGGPVLLPPFLLSAHSLYVGQRSGPLPVELARDVSVRLPTAGHWLAAPPLRAFSWLSDDARALIREELLLDGRGEHGHTRP